MSDKSTNEILAEATVEASKELAKETYNDIVHPTAKAVGGFFGTLAGFFSNVVIYPLKKLNIEYEQKAIAFEREMQEKYNNIPEQKRCEPRLSVVGPAMEALKYNLLEEKLREMFNNLLVSSMDTRKNDCISPAFIRIIEQMSENDAVWFKELVTSAEVAMGDFYVAHLVIREIDSHGKLLGHLPQYCSPHIDNIGIYEAALTISNLMRLGLVELEKIPSNQEIIDDILTEFSKLDNFKKHLKYVQADHGEFKLYYDVETLYRLNITDVGRSFAIVCIEEYNTYEI